jgi:hypothetical protein
VVIPKYDVVKNRFGFWVGRVELNGKMVEVSNAFEQEARALGVAERMAQAEERNRHGTRTADVG